MKKIKVANEIILNLLNTDVENNHLLFDKVLEEFKNGNLNIALDLIDEQLLLKKEENIAQLRLIKANMYNIQNNYDKALDNYRKAFEINSCYEFFSSILTFSEQKL
ncbi:MAG: hypothetical protein IPM96_21050 [Ignavibacteria bacterium]|nr:hypothetical protein [Ignavibacteria bacterium]